MDFQIEPARPEQVGTLCAIERAALGLLAGHRAWPAYRDAAIPPPVLLEAIGHGLVWVASVQGEAAGFVWLGTEEGEGAAGIAELNVLPARGQQGIGAALLEHACLWARAAGFQRVDLGTLADVPWNAPFYARHGFSVVDKRDPAFTGARARDLEHGFPEDLRVFMSRPLTPPSPQEWSIWPAPAKLNLFLRITGRTNDGYHQLQTVFQLLDWGDELRLRVRDDRQLLRASGNPDMPPEDDLVIRAARLLREVSGVAAGAEIALIKRIPVGGGLGGGSSDAATVLVALNWLWRCGLDHDHLAALGRQLGADVPVFVRGQSAWAEGIGDQLTPLRLPRRYYVVVDPHETVPTAALFQAPELTRNAPPATISSFVSGATVENAFEPVARSRYSRVAGALDWLGGFGRARLSGSGGCVFLELRARERAEVIARRCPIGFTAHVVGGLDRSPLHVALERHRAAQRQDGKQDKTI